MPPLSSPFFSSFHPSFSLFHLGRMAGLDSKFNARSSRGTEEPKFNNFFFPLRGEKTPLPRERPVFLAKLFLSRLPGTFLGGGGGGGEDSLYHPGAATRNGFCLLRREQIIFCCKSMDPRVFNQILRFFARGGGYDGKDGLDLNGFRLG